MISGYSNTYIIIVLTLLRRTGEIYLPVKLKSDSQHMCFNGRVKRHSGHALPLSRPCLCSLSSIAGTLLTHSYPLHATSSTWQLNLIQVNFIYSASVTIKIVSRCFGNSELDPKTSNTSKEKLPFNGKKSSNKARLTWRRGRVGEIGKRRGAFRHIKHANTFGIVKTQDWNWADHWGQRSAGQCIVEWCQRTWRWIQRDGEMGEEAKTSKPMSPWNRKVREACRYISLTDSSDRNKTALHKREQQSFTRGSLLVTGEDDITSLSRYKDDADIMCLYDFGLNA